MSTPSETASRGQRSQLPPDIPREEPSAAERVQTEHAVRTAATMAAQLEGGSLPRAVIDYIVATSDFRQNRQALEARAASIANHVVNDVRAPNFSGAHPNDVAAYLASIGRQFGDHRRHMALTGSLDDVREGGAARSGGSKSAAYSREFGGDTYNALARQGYKAEHIHSALGFAREMGTSDDMAKKFIKLDHGSRDRVRGFVEQIESDPSLTPEQKQEKIRQFRGQNPKIREHLTEDDLNKILEGRARKARELLGEQEATAEGAHTKVQAGVERQLERQHTATVATLQATPGANHAEDDELAAIAARRVAQTQPKPVDATPQQSIRHAETTTPAVIHKKSGGEPATANTAQTKAATATATAPKLS